MKQSFLPLHDLPFFVYYDPLDDLHAPSSKSLDGADDASSHYLPQLPAPQPHISRALSASILPSATSNPFSFLKMTSVCDPPTSEAAKTVAPAPRSPLRTSDASSSSSPHPYAHARGEKLSPRERVRAMQADDEERVKKVMCPSKHTEIISQEVFDEQPQAILDPNGVPYALGVAALESHYTAIKTTEKELPNPYVHRHQRDRERRRARRREPPAKPTPEQTAFGKYRLAYECYDDEYRDEILTYMYKCMVRPRNLPSHFPVNILTFFTG